MKPLYKYFPVFVFLLIVAILSTGLYGGFVVRSLFIQRITAGLEDTAEMLKNLILLENRGNIDEFCKTAGTRYSRITVIADDGGVLGDSIARPEEMENHGGRPEIKVAFLGAAGNSVRYSDTLKRTMVYIALPAFDFFGSPIVLRTATPFSSLNDELKTAYVRIAVVGSIILVLVSFLGIVLTRKANEALQIIRTAVREYASGNLQYRPSIYRPPALKEVADTISDLAGDLQSQVMEVSRQRDQLETVFSGMEEAVIVIGTDLTIQEMNDSAYLMTDFDRDEVIGKDLLLVFRNSDLHRIAERISKTKERAEGEVILFKGRRRHLQVHGSVISTSGEGAGRGAGKEQTRIVLVLNDVSRLKELEGVRKDFVANVSHELKTPITAVKGYVETLLEGAYEDLPTSERFLNIVLRHVDRLTAIVEDLLVISRLESDDGPEPEREACDLNALLLNVVSLYEVRAKESGVEIRLDCPSEMMIYTDAFLLEQAVVNLVDNGLKYSESNGRLEIRAAQDEHLVSISVRDYGAGIPEDHLERIFERFYRVDNGRSRELGGTGLGLSIVKHIAVSLGGRVEVESVEGEGSVFTIFLPNMQVD